MRILILTQTVNKNDPVLGFFHRWIEEFSAQVEQVEVVGLSVGEHELSDHTQVYSLGKEKGIGRLGRIFRFYYYVWKKRKEYDVVFVHMNPEYVVLGGLLWRLLGKKIVLWYTHKSVDLKLRIATFLTHMVCTASKESFNIQSNKVVVTGHGIDTSVFAFSPHARNSTLNVITVGRISPVKNVLLVVRALSELTHRGVPAQLRIVGNPITPSDRLYLEEVETFVKENNLQNYVNFIGGVGQNELRELLSSSDVLIHASETGSLDKVILEAMAVGVLPVTSSIACGSVLKEDRETLVFKERDVTSLVETIVNMLERKDVLHIQERLRKEVEENHGLSRLISRILETIHGETSR